MWAPNHKWSFRDALPGGLIPLVIGVVIGLVAMYYFFARDLPEARREVQQVLAKLDAISKELKDAEERQRSSLNQHTREETAARNEIKTSLGRVQVSMVSLRQQVEKRPLTDSELRDMLNNVRAVSVAEAKLFKGYTTLSGSSVR